MNSLDLFSFAAMVALISLSGVMAPGPLFAATIAAGRDDPRAGFMISAGHAAVEIPLIAILFLFGSFLGEVERRILAFVGGVVLLYIAYTELRSEMEKKVFRNFFTGAIMSALNPYFLLWWATIGLSLATKAVDLGMIGLLVFIVVHEACDFGWLGFVGYSSGKGATIWGDKAVKTLKIVSSGLLAVFGIYFIVSALI
jgi:threonine/homoserine/homoserine lactone efflux protein